MISRAHLPRVRVAPPSCRHPAPAQPPAAKKKLAVVTNVWTYRSHAWHMAERFLHGYPVEGKWHHPPIEVVSAYVDQMPGRRPEPRPGEGVRVQDLPDASPKPCAAAATSWRSMRCW